MFGLPGFLLSSEQRMQEVMWREVTAQVEEKAFEVLAKKAINWNPNFKYSDLSTGRKICFKASTYVAPKPVFDAKPTYLTQENGPYENDVLGPIVQGNRADCNVQWIYRNVILPRGVSLWVCFGNARGTIYFDGEITFPILYTYKLYDTTQKKFIVWMSHTPMEVFSQRAGVRHCSGNVCIGGHGLGWFLEQVAKKRSVKSIVMVEKSKELINWFAREQAERIAKETGTPIEMVCGDVFEYLAKHHRKFDKIALDVFKYYGNNNAEDDMRIRDLLWGEKQYWGSAWGRRLIEPKKIWIWGSVRVGQQ